MANENVTQPNNADRTKLACDAAGEIMCVTQMLMREANQDGFDAVLRGALQRINDLSSVCLSVTGGDDWRTMAEMQQVIFGNHHQIKAG